MKFISGMKIVHRAQSSWGVGHVIAVSEDPPRLSAQFPGRPGPPVILSSRDKQLFRWKFPAGAQAAFADGSPASVLRQLPGPADELFRYTVEAPGKKPQVRAEADLRAVAPREGPAERLASGHWGHSEDFALRTEVVKLDLERRADALGALFASRVYVKPHQVSVAHQVLSARAPRFVLADEVGLGKTIEAGLVLSALLHAGLVKRCLVVAPSHLTVQWLAELFHKFNLLFTLMDPDRARDAREDLGGADEFAAELEPSLEAASLLPPPVPGASPPVEPVKAPARSLWASHNLVITSLEWLSRAKDEAAEAAEAGWDLVVFDEAHHLRGERAYEVASALSEQTWGLLLLTATPLQLDPAEYYRLLKLVDPAPAQTEAELRARLARQGDLSAEVRALLDGDQGAAKRIADLFPDDPALAKLQGEALLSHLAESYGLSARLLRNRRAIVGGFTKRSLSIVDVVLSPAERALETDVRLALHAAHANGSLPGGAVLAALLRRMGSSPPALAAGLAAAADPGLKKLAPAALAIAADGADAKFAAFRELLTGPLAAEKVLVFAEARETIEYLRDKLARSGGLQMEEQASPATGGGRRAAAWTSGIEALAYAGDLSPAERDKLVARFRDPDGPRVLLCTELGGEGRNFQHCHVLVNYDLAWSPAAIEQRIGRIDRIGQSREVRIYAFRPEGTLAARVLDVLDGGVGVFTEPVGGLDAVLEKVEGELAALGARAPAAKAASTANANQSEEALWKEEQRGLFERVQAARREVSRAHDPLLDRRSCDVQAVRELAERGARRVGLSLPQRARGAKGAATSPLEEAGALLGQVAAQLERRLEAVTIEVARRVGLEVDIEVDVLPGEVSFHVGPELKVDALAGFDLSQDRVVLGSFRREISVAHEEHESFATGHPLVEALFGWVRDGELGRASVYRAHVPGTAGVALDARWIVALPEPADLAQGAKVPSRRAARYLDEPLVRVLARLDGRGGVSIDEGLGAQLDSAEAEAVLAPDGGPPAPFVAAVEAGLSAATSEAQKRLIRLLARARERVSHDRSAAQQRLSRFLAQSRVAAAERDQLLESEGRLYDQVEAALGGARLELDQVALVQLL